MPKWVRVRIPRCVYDETLARLAVANELLKQTEAHRDALAARLQRLIAGNARWPLLVECRKFLGRADMAVAEALGKLKMAQNEADALEMREVKR